MNQQDKEFIETTPKKIADRYVADMEIHGMNTQNATARLIEAIKQYGQVVASIVIADRKG